MKIIEERKAILDNLAHEKKELEFFLSQDPEARRQFALLEALEFTINRIEKLERLLKPKGEKNENKNN